MKKRLLVLIAVAAALFILPCALPYAANAADDGPEPSGKIPVLTITIGGQDAEYIDDETGETVTEKLTADEVIEKMNSSDDHSFRATNGKVSLTITEGLKKYSSPDGTYCIPSEGLALEFMRGRGNSTWLPGEDNKKPYKFKLQKRAKLVGDNSSKHWVLMANALDPTKVKNKFTSWLGCSLGMEFTPECIPVDVVLKGETYNKYLGCYYLSEEVRVDKSSVDVASWCEEQDDGTVVPNEPEGTGYLLGMTSKNMEDYSFDTERGTEFTIEEPSFETDEGSGALLEGTEEQREYIENYIQAVEDLIYSDGFTEKNSSAYDELGEMMDLKAAADYWWIQELSLNGDAYNTPSTYLYKKADQTNEDGTVTKGKLYWGPLWDFDLAWDDDFFIRIFTSTHNAWFDRLRQNPEFAELLEVEWIKIKRLLDEASRDGGMIDQFKEEIADSYALDAKIWEGSEGYDIDLDKEPYAALKHMISSKRKICQDNIDDIGHVYADLTFVADGKVIDVLHPYFKELADEIAPDAPDKDDSVFEGWYTKDGTSYNDEIIADKDMTFYAKYIPEEEASKTQKILFPTKYMCTRTEEDGLCFIDYVLVPYDALDKRIEWTSSDENVLSPLNKGVFEYKGTGETVITAKIKGTGVSNSLTVYVYGEDEEVPAYKDVTMTKSLTISEGDSDQIIVTPTPERSDFFLNYMCTFSTDNDDIITVSDDGTVNALSPGTAEVTMEVSASAAMGDNDPVTRKCAVRVTGDLGSADVSGIKNLIYSGKAKAQSPIVKYDGNTLKKGTDYTLSYKNNVNVGTATVIITGKGCYTGTVKKTFRISPKGTKIKKLTKKRKAIKVRWKKQARKMKKSRITGYQIMVATNKAFTKNKKTVNVKGYKKTSKTIKKLKAKRKYYVRIRTFKKVNGTKYYSKWSKIRKIKTK